MMRVKLRMGQAHDTDLLWLYHSAGAKEFSRIARNVLHCYTEGIAFNSSGIGPFFTEKEELPPVTCNLTLDNRYSKEIELLERVVPGKRGAFIKTLLRMYLAFILLGSYFQQDEPSYSVSSAKVPVYAPVQAPVTTRPKTAPSIKKKEASNPPSVARKEETRTKKETPLQESEAVNIPAPVLGPATSSQDEDGLSSLSALFGGFSVS